MLGVGCRFGYRNTTGQPTCPGWSNRLGALTCEGIWGFPTGQLTKNRLCCSQNHPGGQFQALWHPGQGPWACTRPHGTECTHRAVAKTAPIALGATLEGCLGASQGALGHGAELLAKHPLCGKNSVLRGQTVKPLRNGGTERFSPVESGSDRVHFGYASKGRKKNNQDTTRDTWTRPRPLRPGQHTTHQRENESDTTH